jgi:quercetin dioxygenase-like cupin family protein
VDLFPRERNEMSSACRIGSTPTVQSFQEYKASHLKQGFDEVIEREWAPATVVPAHMHEFAAKALVVKGEMWLTVGSDTHHLLPGNTFELNSGVLHSERYGSDGATYWVARRGSA